MDLCATGMLPLRLFYVSLLSLLLLVYFVFLFSPAAHYSSAPSPLTLKSLSNNSNSVKFLPYYTPFSDIDS